MTCFLAKVVSLHRPKRELVVGKDKVRWTPVPSDHSNRGYCLFTQIKVILQSNPTSSMYAVHCQGLIYDSNTIEYGLIVQRHQLILKYDKNFICIKSACIYKHTYTHIYVQIKTFLFPQHTAIASGQFRL